MRLFGDAHFGQELHGLGLCFFLAALAHHLLRQHDVLQHRQVRKEVELLEHHAHLGAHGVDILCRVQGDAVNDDLAAVEFLQAVDAAQQGRFSRARWPDNHHYLAFTDIQADAAKRFDHAERFGYIFNVNDRFFHCVS